MSDEREDEKPETERELGHTQGKQGEQGAPGNPPGGSGGQGGAGGQGEKGAKGEKGAQGKSFLNFQPLQLVAFLVVIAVSIFSSYQFSRTANNGIEANTQRIVNSQAATYLKIDCTITSTLREFLIDSAEIRELAANDSASSLSLKERSAAAAKEYRELAANLEPLQDRPCKR